MSDPIEKPAHYTRWIIEPIVFIMKNKMEFWRGNVVKYVCRAGYKLYDGLNETESERTDLLKARRYIDIRLEELNESLSRD